MSAGPIYTTAMQRRSVRDEERELEAEKKQHKKAEEKLQKAEQKLKEAERLVKEREKDVKEREKHLKEGKAKLKGELEDVRRLREELLGRGDKANGDKEKESAMEVESEGNEIGELSLAKTGRVRRTAK